MLPRILLGTSEKLDPEWGVPELESSSRAVLIIATGQRTCTSLHLRGYFLCPGLSE